MLEVEESATDPRIIELSEDAKDDDGDDLTWEVENTSTEVKVSIDEEKNTAIIEVIKRVIGQAKITFKVSST